MCVHEEKGKESTREGATRERKRRRRAVSVKPHAADEKISWVLGQLGIVSRRQNISLLHRALLAPDRTDRTVT